jgi:hypothetical protein
MYKTKGGEFRETRPFRYHLDQLLKQLLILLIDKYRKRPDTVANIKIAQKRLEFIGDLIKFALSEIN